MDVDSVVASLYGFIIKSVLTVLELNSGIWSGKDLLSPFQIYVHLLGTVKVELQLLQLDLQLQLQQVRDLK